MPRDRGFPVRPVGDRACIVDLPDLDRVLGVAARLRELAIPGVVDIVPATCTVLVVCDGREAVHRVSDAVSGFEPDVAAGETVGREVTIDVVYDGDDLEAVGELTGLGAEGVVAAHTGAAWRAAFGGFAPGFAYLVGGDERLRVPRLDSPRTAVPAGSVAIAGEFSAVYPGESPGGWRLLGRTGERMWDESRDRPALVSPGDSVRFRAVRERVAAARGASGADGEGSLTLSAGSDDAADTAEAAIAREGSSPALAVVRPGMLTLVQDGGRPGNAALGVTESGALDRAALRAANRAVGNRLDAAGLEHLGGGLVLRAERDTAVAVTGADAEISVTTGDGRSGAETSAETREAAAGEEIALRAGDRLTLGAPQHGLRCYVAVRGGIAGRTVLGSLAHDSLSGLGTAPLAPGDTIATEAIGEPDPESVNGSGTDRDPSPAPAPADLVPVLRFVAGPRDDWFTEGSLAAFAERPWRVTPQSNRIGLRLDGEPLEREREGELPTEGMVRGSIQVPPNGLPVLFLADHPTTGGYPVIGTVVDDDLDRAAQLSPGSEVRFVAVDPDDIGEPRGAAAPPERVDFSIEVDGRRHAVAMAGALASAIDRAGAEGDRSASEALIGEIVRSLDAGTGSGAR
ncbi:5-oxoprolinase/urea amidolyase family protein [Leucobacter ruminantium]|uniref:5-oxoprolinase/urea amidolyase family protein n=1 Tax=Leucobacter ruminantium TaxID=1289170 RepID=A0A939RXV2_9MICO|nr:5-oxoprolinase/urea amidolyase family protein [Leucobacter ruminantium]MBO1803814.1 5-oxoprolinase/urea amidolyase family protein [Leucobacter ruminantium]